MALSHGYVLFIPVVTDDRDMRTVGRTFNVETMKTLKLLKLMLDAKHITIQKIRQIVGYWSYENDRPANCTSDYRKLFGESPPP